MKIKILNMIFLNCDSNKKETARLVMENLFRISHRLEILNNHSEFDYSIGQAIEEINQALKDLEPVTKKYDYIVKGLIESEINFMLNINNKNLKVTKQEIHIGKFTNNGDEGYNVCIGLKFVNDDNVKGYLNLDAGFEKNNDIIAFLNREYNGIPFENDNQFIYFEVFDTEKFLDTEIESKIIIRLENLKNSKVKVFFELNDELIEIRFDGYLDVISIL